MFKIINSFFILISTYQNQQKLNLNLTLQVEYDKLLIHNFCKAELK